MVTSNSSDKRTSAKTEKKATEADRGNSPDAVQDAAAVPLAPPNPTTGFPKVARPEQEDAKVEVAPIIPVRQAARVIDNKVEKEAEDSVLPQVIQPVEQTEMSEELEKPVVNPVEKPVEKAAEKPFEKPVQNPGENPVNQTAVQPPDGSVKMLEDESKPNGVVAEKEGVVTTFEWSATDATEVILAGSFNDWKQDLVMTKRDGKFSVDVTLQPGKHFYKFIADGDWYYDFMMPNEPDSSGNVNNIIVVGQA